MTLIHPSLDNKQDQNPVLYNQNNLSLLYDLFQIFDHNQIDNI